MYIVNTTFVIEPAAHQQWLEFITQKVIPQIKQQGFNIIAFTRVLNETSQGDYTYSLQVQAHDIEQYQRYTNEIIQDYASLARNLYGEAALHITTLLKKIPLE